MYCRWSLYSYSALSQGDRGNVTVPVYHFIWNSSETPPIIDRDGQEFPDDKAAYAHATEVARELMRNREAKCRSSRLQVRDQNLMPCFEILFASIDETLAHLPTPCRNQIERAARAEVLLNDTLEEVTLTLTDVNKTLSAVKETLVTADAILATGRMPA